MSPHAIRSIFRIAICTCMAVAVVPLWSQGAPASTLPERAEFMRADLFSRKDWKSTDVQVAGLYLGMSRKEANVTARQSGFELVQSVAPAYQHLPCSNESECFLATSPKKRERDAVSIHFGKVDQIISIDLEMPPFDYFDYKGGILLRELKGRTRRFFEEPYVDRLRLELFGPETRQELVDGGYSSVAKDTQYIYANRGITVTVSHPRTAVYYLESLSFIPVAPAAP